MDRWQEQPPRPFVPGMTAHHLALPARRSGHPQVAHHWEQDLGRYYSTGWAAAAVAFAGQLAREKARGVHRPCEEAWRPLGVVVRLLGSMCPEYSTRQGEELVALNTARLVEAVAPEEEHCPEPTAALAAIAHYEAALRM